MSTGQRVVIIAVIMICVGSAHRAADIEAVAAICEDGPGTCKEKDRGRLGACDAGLNSESGAGQERGELVFPLKWGE